MAVLPTRLPLATLLPLRRLLVPRLRRLLVAGVPLLAALRRSALALLARGAVLSSLPARLLPTRLTLEPSLLTGLRLGLLASELPLLATLLARLPLLLAAALLAGLSPLSGLTRLPALLTELPLGSDAGSLLAGLGLLSAPLLARSTPLLRLVAPGRLCLLAAAGLLSLEATSPALSSRLALASLLPLLSLLARRTGRRLLLAAELATLLAPLWLLALWGLLTLRRLLAPRRLLPGLTRLSARLAGLLGLAALLPRRLATLLTLEPALLAPLPGGVARPLLASRWALLVRLFLLVALSLPALLAPVSAVLFASALGVAVLPAHGAGPGGRTRSSE